ncbi:hypothetical protein [Virgisporangium aurantiacum]|uniref:Uncharacterized protein n=1 Tax=Virgisporangium aurantiacum TaxID=175570 RepID=A0A8J3YZP1_9ACTN|nr:hypothetical protein [Virgisporangium aurantiacum]GIJ52508.1 hypothetical protein Vau01_000240 [Virgisporangium aurantiacum]
MARPETPQPENWRSAWVAALDALDADVVLVEELLADAQRVRDLPLSDPWSPPAGLGPLPLDLRPRADAILARQLHATRQLTLAIAANRKQAAFAARVEAGGYGKAPPSYVDRAM